MVNIKPLQFIYVQGVADMNSLNGVLIVTVTMPVVLKRLEALLQRSISLDAGRFALLALTSEVCLKFLYVHILHSDSPISVSGRTFLT